LTAWTPPPSVAPEVDRQRSDEEYPSINVADPLSVNSAEPFAASPERNELDRLQPIGRRFKLTSGTEVEIQDLKLRQFLKFIKILTSGASEIWSTMQINTDDTNAFMRDIAGLALFAIPEAEEQTVDFLKSIVMPADMPEGNDRSARDKRLEMLTNLYAELENPELDDALSLIQAIIEAEAADLMALGKRLRRMFETVQRSIPSSTLPTSSS
jgi:hypothetical protein